MKLALFNDYRLGLVADGQVRDASGGLAWRDTGWPWLFVSRTIERFDKLRPELEAAALEAVFGYTCLIDFTVRGQGDRSRRKSYDGFTPLGPLLVTADEISDPH